MNRRRRTQPAFPEEAEYPSIRASVTHRVTFSEVDPMGIVWFGRYAVFFEEALTVLRDGCGLSHRDFYQAGIMPPVVSYDVDYQRPSRLDELLTVTARLHGTEAARMNVSYQIHGQDGQLRVAARTVHVFIEAAGGGVCFVPPPIWTACLARWKRGEFSCLHG